MNHSVSFTSQDSDQGPVPRPGYWTMAMCGAALAIVAIVGLPPPATSHLLALTMVSVSGLSSHHTIHSLNSHIGSHNITITHLLEATSEPQCNDEVGYCVMVSC